MGAIHIDQETQLFSKSKVRGGALYSWLKSFFYCIFVKIFHYNLHHPAIFWKLCFHQLDSATEYNIDSI